MTQMSTRYPGLPADLARTLDAKLNAEAQRSLQHALHNLESCRCREHVAAYDAGWSAACDRAISHLTRQAKSAPPYIPATDRRRSMTHGQTT